MPGIYLFPSGVIDARGHKLRVFPFTSSTPPAVSGQNLLLPFPEATFTFPVAAGHLEQAKSVIEEAESRVERARAADDRKTLGLLDPLVDVGVANPFAPKTRIVRVVPIWARYGILFGIAAAAALAPGVWWLRNRSSDEGMLSDATSPASSRVTRLSRSRRAITTNCASLSSAPRAARRGQRWDRLGGGEYHRGSSQDHHPFLISPGAPPIHAGRARRRQKAGTVSRSPNSEKHPKAHRDNELRQALPPSTGSLAKSRKERARSPTLISFVDRLLAVARRAAPR